MLLSRSLSPDLFSTGAALAAVAYPNEAKDYDMDCKLILGLAGGFPATCSDAHDHMIDRLRDGKSPIGTCTMSDGSEYNNYAIDYSFCQRHQLRCVGVPEGKNKHFSREYDGDSRK